MSIAKAANCLDGDRASLLTFTTWVASIEPGFYVYSVRITSAMVLRAFYAAASGVAYIIVRLNQ